MSDANEVVTLSVWSGLNREPYFSTSGTGTLLNEKGLVDDLLKRVKHVTGMAQWEIRRHGDSDVRIVMMFQWGGFYVTVEPSQPLDVLIYELAMKHLIKEKDVSKMTDVKFKPGDVVVHKTDGYRKFVVVDTETNGVTCSYLWSEFGGSGIPTGKVDARYADFSPNELEHYVEKKDVVSNVCERCPYACENGGFGDGDDAEDDDPFALDDDDFPADVGETDVTLMDLDELLTEVIDRLQEEGFDKLAATVAYVKCGYTKGVKNG